MQSRPPSTPPGPRERFPPSGDLFAWLNEQFDSFGEVFRASVHGSEVFVVSDPDLCARVLRWNWLNYPRKGQVVKRISLLLGAGLIGSNGAFWASQRRMIQPAFSRRAIDAMTPTMTSASEVLAERWRTAAKGHATVNVTRDVSESVLEITLRTIFGEDYQIAASAFESLADNHHRDMAFADAVRRSGATVAEIAGRRRREEKPGADILGVLLQSKDRVRGEAMSEAQLVREVLTLVVAGHETTAGLLNWLWWLLSRHPEVDNKLRAELDRLPWSGALTQEDLARYGYVRQVIEEALRLYPPLWLMTRKAESEDRLGEFAVPKGTEIYISPYLLQRNPGVWDSPEAFDPDRMDPEKSAARHALAACPFGAGPRNCIGEAFARAEMQIHVMTIARRLRLASDQDGTPVIAAGMNLLTRSDIFLRPQLRPEGRAERGS